jgi:CheY-like chemotaxis protein
MKRLLLIEDDENKVKQLVECLMELSNDFDIHRAASVRSATSKLNSDNYDIVLLDMSMPTFDVGTDDDSGRPQIYGGRVVLKQMQRRSIQTPVILVTQFDRFGIEEGSKTLRELSDELAKSHPEVFRGSVYYNATLDSWKTELRALLREILSI